MEEKDAYYSKTGDGRDGVIFWEAVDGGEVRVTLVVDVGTTPQHGFKDLVYVGRVRKYLRSEKKENPFTKNLRDLDTDRWKG